MSNSNELKEFVETLLKQKLEGVEISCIEFTRDKDEDGEDVLIITVVFDAGKGSRLDPGKTSGLARRIIPAIRDIMGEELFPVLSFISKSELKGHKAAIA